MGFVSETHLTSNTWASASSSGHWIPSAGTSSLIRSRIWVIIRTHVKVRPTRPERCTCHCLTPPSQLKHAAVETARLLCWVSMFLPACHIWNIWVKIKTNSTWNYHVKLAEKCWSRNMYPSQSDSSFTVKTRVWGDNACSSLGGHVPSRFW